MATVALQGSDSVVVDLRDIARRQRMAAVALRQHTDPAVTAMWRGLPILLQMIALAALTSAQLGAAVSLIFLLLALDESGLERIRHSMIVVFNMVAVPAVLSVLAIFKYCFHRARGRELTMLHATKCAPLAAAMGVGDSGHMRPCYRRVYG